MDGSAQGVRMALAQLLGIVELGESELKRVLSKLDQLRRHYVASPHVPEKVNWQTYSHPELYEMVHQDAEPKRVGDQSRQIDDLAWTAYDTCEGVTRNAIALESAWRGPAAQSAFTTVEQHARGGEEVRRFVASVATALDLASAALRRAQLAMPKPVNPDDAAAVGAVGGSAAFGPIGGFVGSEIAKCAANQAAEDARSQAVAVMEAYEQELHDAYRQITRPAELPPNGKDNRFEWITHDPPIVHPPPRIVPGKGGSGGGSGQGTTSSGTGAPAPIPSVQSGVQAAGFSPAAGTSAAFAGGMAMPDGPGGGSPAAWRDLTGRGAVPGLLAGGRPGLAGAGPRAGRPSSPGQGRRGGLPGLGAPGGSTARDEEDTEHHNKLPHSDQLFTFKDHGVLAPPVIGED